MSAPRENTPGPIEGQNTKLKDVVLCEGAQAPLSIPNALVTEIWEQVNQGLRATPTEGAEVGGLLLGCGGESAGILVEAVAPISVEHGLRVCATDLKAIDALMASLQEDRSKAVVGFYRSRIRNDSLPADYDGSILATLEQTHRSFHADFRYFIIFTPLSKLRMMVSASFRTDEGWAEWQHVNLVRNSPVASSSPESTTTPAANRPRSEPPPVRPAPASEELLNPADPIAGLVPTAEPCPRFANAMIPSERPWFRAQGYVTRTWLYPVCAVLLVAVSVGLYSRLRPAVPRVGLPETTRSAILSEIHSASTPLDSKARRPGLSANWDGNIWKVTWNRENMEALNPGAAVLSIRDGDRERNIDLAPSILSSGAIFYAPESENLLFRLKVLSRSGVTSEEHVRVLQGQIIETPEESISPIIDRETSLSSPQPALPSDRSAHISSQPKASHSPRRIAARALPAAANRSASLHHTVTKPIPLPMPPAANARNRALFVPLPPPSVNPQPGLAVNLPSSETTCCTATATYEPAGPSGVQGVLHKIPVIRKLTFGRASGSKGYVPPRPLHNLEFALPPAASPTLMETKQMDLKAMVDASGRVTRVKLLSPRDKALATLTVYAAKNWRFEPAQLNEDPVPAEVVLHFRFDNTATAVMINDNSNK